MKTRAEHEKVRDLIKRKQRDMGEAWLKHWLGDSYEKIGRLESLSCEELHVIVSKII